MSRKASHSTNAVKVSVFSKDIEYTASKAPEVNKNFMQKFIENSAPRKDFSNYFVINVLPNFVPILCYILYHVNHLCPLLEQTKHAKISPGTFTAYCLAIVYGYILCCDLYVREPMSTHAAAWENDAQRQRFLEFLFTLPVPDFLQPLLLQLTPTITEHRGNVLFVPSAAGFSYAHHFGRFFPLIMFTNLHDTAAETTGRASPMEIMTDYFSRTLFTLTTVRNGVANGNLSAANFLGTYFQVNAAGNHTYGSRLEQFFTSTFNPVLFRDYQRRQTLASVSLRPQTYATRFMNFYDLVFSASTGNLSELRIVFQQIAGAMKDNIKCEGDLASYFKTFSGVSILTHGYSEHALPTYHHSPLVFPANNAPFAKPTLVEPVVFAQQIRFLQRPANTVIPNTAYPVATATQDGQIPTPPVVITYDRIYNRLQAAAGQPQRPNLDTDFVIFSESRHLFPKVYVFTMSGSTSEAHTATLFGLVIESMDLDGTVIPVPNTNLSLGIENTFFAESCIPIRYCAWSIIADTTAGTFHFRAMTRALPPRQTRFGASSLLRDRTRIDLPTLQPTGVQTGIFAGFTALANVNWPAMIQSFLGFRTTDRRATTDADDNIEEMPLGRLLVWSPYTYVGHEPESDNPTTYADTHIYFVTNLRTIFGTNVPLIEVSNGLESMPIS